MAQGLKEHRVDRYGLLGHPVSQSLSPRIHGLFAQATGRVLAYDLFDVPPGAVAEEVRRLVTEGYLGFNVTVPHKGEVIAATDRLTRRASLAQAVNTLILRPGEQIEGDNTDGVGLVRDLTRHHGLALTGSRMLLLGAGGAARGVVGPLLAERPASLTIANRTPEKAERLATRFAALGPVDACGFEDLRDGRFDLVINATAASLAGDVPGVPAGALAGAVCYDMAYGGSTTAFTAWAKQAGAREALQGLGMLVEQAAESFYLWRGVRPETGSVLSQLQKELRLG